MVPPRQEATMRFKLDHLFVKPYNDITDVDDDDVDPTELVRIGSSRKELRAFGVSLFAVQ
jgi:hypothetical protein